MVDWAVPAAAEQLVMSRAWQAWGGSGLYSKTNERPEPFRIASLNVGTMRGKSNEIAEVLSRRKVDLLCLQELD